MTNAVYRDIITGRKIKGNPLNKKYWDSLEIDDYFQGWSLEYD